MNLSLTNIAITVLCSCLSLTGIGQSNLTSTSLFSIDQPASQHKKIFQQLNFSIPAKMKAEVHIDCFQIRDEDSIKLYDLYFQAAFKTKLGSVKLYFDKTSKLQYTEKDFLKVIEKFGVMPPGQYYLKLSVLPKDSVKAFYKDFEWSVDSTLAYNSDLRSEINNSISNKSAFSNRFIQAALKKKPKPGAVSGAELSSVSRQLNRNVGCKQGVEAVPQTIGTKKYTALYFRKYFLGRYEITEKKELDLKIAAEQKILKENPASFIRQDLSSLTSISSQNIKLNLDGPNLENLEINNKVIKFYWLIPINESEMLFINTNGIEALEELFDEKQFNYINPKRESVV